MSLAHKQHSISYNVSILPAKFDSSTVTNIETMTTAEIFHDNNQRREHLWPVPQISITVFMVGIKLISRTIFTDIQLSKYGCPFGSRKLR
jgi:hypothetical protein